MKTIKLSFLFIAVAMLGSIATVRADSAVPKTYPLKKCVVSDEALGEGGMKPFKVAHEGTDVWLCCKSCKKDFDKDPAKYAGMVKDAAPKK